MVSQIKLLKESCPFCGKELESKFAKCFNIYCQGGKFNKGNLVLYRLNKNLGLGRIIKVIEIPTSKTLDDEDTQFFYKYKVLFNNNIVKITPPIDLIHYVFDVNEKVVSKHGTGIINSKDFIIKDGIISYELLKENGKKIQIYENEIYAKYIPPIDALISEHKPDPPRNFLIKYWANLFYSYYTSYRIKCITNSRLTLMQHQINVTHRLTEEYFPRIILADEVGLGKTIEAGIYIKEMMARNLAERILIIVPASLIKQWSFELNNKFNISFTIYDGKKIKEVERKGSYKSQKMLQNPFYYDNLILCSLQFARNRRYIEDLSQISWDIIIFDEAHHLRRYLTNSTTGKFRETLNYELARKLSYSTESLLLLTATPLQLHSFELFSLINLITPNVFASFSEFEHFRKNMPFINLLTTNINQIEKLNNFEAKNTLKLLKDLKYVTKDKNQKQFLADLDNKSIKLKLLQRIENDHTLSKYLIRNRKKNIFTDELISKRIVSTILVNPTKDELNIYNEIRLYLAQTYNSSVSNENAGLGFVITTLQKLLTSSKYAILKSLERRLEQITRYKHIILNMKDIEKNDPEYYELESENEFLDSDVFNPKSRKSVENQEEDNSHLLNQEKILKEFCEKLKKLPYDSKANKLLKVVNQIYSQNPKEKLIIFTQFVDTLKFLRELLKKQNNNCLVEIFYGGLDKDQKDEAVERFRNYTGFSILLSTEIGGEGRNFQFCRTLINYDLPWNPMKLEQRIGRLDRIGQKSREIFIYNFFMENTVEADVLYALIKRINLFEESIGILEPIIGRVERDLKNVIFAEDNQKKRTKLNEFYRTLDEEMQKAKEIEMQLDDLMIDKKSFQMEGLISSLASCYDVKLTHNELYLLMKYFFNLLNNQYGKFEFLDQHDEKIPKDEVSIIKITLNNKLSKNTQSILSDEYIGTFNLELAREREEIDFFALGHPMINAILNICREDSFPGAYSILNLKKQFLRNTDYHEKIHQSELYLIIFNIKFQGYIIENQILPIVINKNGIEIKNFENLLLNIENYQKIFQFDNDLDIGNLNSETVQKLQQQAKKLIKSKTSIWKREVKKLNDTIFSRESDKKKKIYEYNRRVLSLKIDSLQVRLERKKQSRPTNRQSQNIRNLRDEIKKQERMRALEKLEEEIRYTEKDLEIGHKKLDDLAFEREDNKNEMNRRNLAKFYTKILSFAIIRIVD